MGGRDSRKSELRAYKEEQGCQDCGLPYPHYVLEFDHTEGLTTTARQARRHPDGNPGRGVLANVARSRAEAWAEAEQCDVVCANCHKTRTHNRREAAKHGT